MISNQENKLDAKTKGQNRLGDGHAKRQRKTSQGNRGRFENLTTDQFQQQNLSLSSNNIGPDNVLHNPGVNNQPLQNNQSGYGLSNDKALSELKKIELYNAKSVNDKDSQYTANNMGMPR